MNHFALWPTQTLVCLDVETTGFDLDCDRVVEIGAVRLEGLRVVSKWRSILNPGRPIPPEASRVHGIFDEDVARAPRFLDKLTSLTEFCYGAIPVAYNERFDRDFITMEFRRTKVTPDMPLLTWAPWIDALAWVRSTDRFVTNGGAKVSNSLGAACKRRGIEIDGAHGALADAAALAQLLAAIEPDMPSCTVSELIRRQGAVHAAYNKRWDAAKASGRAP